MVVKKKNARALPPSVIESKKIWTKGGEREREREKRERATQRVFFVCVDPSTTKKR